MSDVTMSQFAQSPAAKLRLTAARVAVVVAFTGVMFSRIHAAAAAEEVATPSDDPLNGTLEVTGVGPYCPPNSTGAFDPSHEVPGGGIGFLTRIGHIAGETVGRNESITHVGLAPYLFHEETMLFGDLRLYRTNEGRTGGSAGLGLRHYLAAHDAIFGVIGYYDNDDSRGFRIQQAGLSLEYLSRLFDARVNWYVPFGDTEFVVGTSIVEDSSEFVEHRLLFDQRTDFSSAAEGVDLLLSTPIPGEVPEMFNLEVSAGAYHYQVRDSDFTKMWGYRLRTDADLFKRILHMFVELTSDRVTNTNVVVGASLNYYHGFENRRRLHDSQFYRMSEWVRRNHTVVTIDEFVITEGELARNPETGDPYFFAHVRNIPGLMVPPPLPDEQPPFFNFPAPFGLGTVERPFQFIQEAQALLQDPNTPPVDRENGVIYVHGDSVFTGDDAVVVLNSGQIVLGEGPADDVVHTLPVLGFSQPLVIQPVIPNSSVPMLADATGDAVTAASDNTFSGFSITNPMGNGITIDTRVNGMFSDVAITGAAGDGIAMAESSGVFQFDRVQINDAADVGFHVDGGTAEVTLADPDAIDGVPTIANMQNEAVLIENTVGGSVNLMNTLIDDNGGAGIRLINNAGNVSLGQAMLDDTMGPAIEIRGGSGNTTLTSDVTITNPSGIGFLVADLARGARVAIPMANMTINMRNNIGAEFNNVDGTVQFGSMSTLTIGAPVTADPTHPAIRFHNGSDGTVRLDDFTITGSPAEGILIGDPAGIMINESEAVFQMGAGVMDAGMISATTGAAFRIAGDDEMEDPTDVEYRGTLVSNTRMGRGIDIQHTTGNIRFFENVVINNNAAVPSESSALFIDDAMGPIAFDNTFTTNDNIGPEPAVDIQNAIAGAGVSFGTLNILDAMGTRGLQVRDTNRLTIGAGTIETTMERAVDIENTSMLDVVLESVSSSNSPDHGIRVVNSPGSFTITGIGNVPGSGGEISDAAMEGALFDRTEEVTIRLQEYTDNFVGIRALNMNNAGNSLSLAGVQITNSVNQGVFTTDVREVMIENSIFTDDGAGIPGARQHILLQVMTNPNPDSADPNQNEQFIYTILNNMFMDTAVIVGDDAVLIETVGRNAEDSRLELFFNSNALEPFDRASAAGDIADRPSGLEINWDGRVDADVLENIVTMGDGDRQVGFSFFTQGNATQTNINFETNEITATGATSDALIGANFDLIGETGLDVINNVIDFSSTDEDNVGLRFRFFDLTSDKRVRILTNDIQMNGGTAIRMPFVSAPASFEIANNLIGFPAGVPDRGIIFDAVNGVIQLSGNLENIVFVQPTVTIIDPITGLPIAVIVDPQNVFDIPVNSSVGQIIVNGSLVP